jgi:hypothetical protein
MRYNGFMIYFLAHAAEFHDTATTETEHVLLTPLIYGAVNLLVIIAVLGLMQLTKVSLGAKLLVAMALLLVGGILGYQYVPTIGGIMIALGVALTLAVALGSLAGVSPAGSEDD